MGLDLARGGGVTGIKSVKMFLKSLEEQQNQSDK